MLHTLHVSMIVGGVGKRPMVQRGSFLALICLLDVHRLPHLGFHT